MFEVSWEVCNKVGGINTVLKSKASLMKKQFKNYFLIGPYFENNAKLEFEEEAPSTPFKKIIASLKKEGIIIHYGTWQIKGEPKVFLLEYDSLMKNKDDYKKELWESNKIDSLFANWDFEEPMIFSKAVATFLNLISKKLKITAQFHEWLTGLTILFLKNFNCNIPTIFTTHATMLGRAMAGSGMNIYDLLDKINPSEQAYKTGVTAKFLTERSAAHNATIFTTVSEITALEAEKLLGRKPDVILPNGLDISKFPTFEETSIKHITCRDKIREFLAYYFFPHYSFDLEHNLLFFMTARNEFKNKGVDITISALGKLNEQLKQLTDDPRTVTMFFWIPMQAYGVKVELLENKNYYTHIKNYLDYNSEKIMKNVLYDLLSQKELDKGKLFTKQFLSEMKKDLMKFKRKGDPSLCTNYMLDEDNEEIIKAFKASGLNNKEEDKVKVILMPVYLNGDDGLFNLPYYEAIAACHLGLFPSYYEPWGYTPLETGAMGVSSLTSDLSGFGQYIKPLLKDKGVFVIDRQGKSYDEVVEDYSKQLLDFVNLSHADRVSSKLEAKRLAALCDWKEFIKYYKEAHDKAVEKFEKENS